MRKLFGKLHLYLGIPLGIFITIVCLSGAILVFREEIRELTHPERYFVPSSPQTEALPLDDLVQRVERELGGDPVTSITIPRDPQRTLQMRTKGGGRTTLYINPYTAEIQEMAERSSSDFFSQVMALHRRLLGERGGIGREIVGYSTLGLVLLLITGLVLWFPRSRRQLKASLTIKTSASRQRLWRDLHNVLGFYLTLGLLVLALTGLYYSPIQWVREGINSLTASSEAETHPRQGERRRAHGQAPSEVQHFEHWQRALDQLRELEPKAAKITLEPSEASVSLYDGWGTTRASNEYAIDPQTGLATLVQRYSDQPLQTKVRGWIYTLHVGAWGGIWSKLLTCAIALLGSSLPITGYYLFVIKRKRRKPSTR